VALDLISVLGGIGLAVVGFVVVILVCVVILRLLASVLPSYPDRIPPAAEDEGDAPLPSEPEAGVETPAAVVDADTPSSE
jgi:hypothetical protein